MKYLKRLYLKTLVNRQRRTNSEIVRMLKQTEYRGESSDYIRHIYKLY